MTAALISQVLGSPIGTSYLGAAMNLNWYKRDPDRALNGMRGLSHDEKSAYGTIIDLSYSRKGDLPDDEHLLCVHIECRPQWWRRVRASLIAKHKIRIVDGKIIANRVETTLKEAANWSQTQSENARKGWVTRKKNNQTNGGTMPSGSDHTTTTREEEEEKPLKGFSSSSSSRQAGSSPNQPASNQPAKLTNSLHLSDEEIAQWLKNNG